MRMERLITTEQCYETLGLLRNPGRASISGMYTDARIQSFIHDTVEIQSIYMKTL
jgi:hypothetical protein